MLEQLFSSKLRARVMGWMCTHPDERYYVRQLTSLIHEDSTATSQLHSYTALFEKNI